MIQTSSDISSGIIMRVSWLQRCLHCCRGILNLDMYDNLCFSYYWVFCHHCLLKGTDPHSVLPAEPSLSGLIGLSSSLGVISLGSRAMFLKVLTADHLHNDHLGTHKNAYSWAPPHSSHTESLQIGPQELAF